MQARVDAHADAVAQVEGLAAGDRDQLLLRDAVDVVQQPYGLMRADHGGAGPRRNALGAPEVVEVRMADEHVVGARDVRSTHADGRCGRHAVHVRVEEDDALADGQAERRDAEPVERHAHATLTAR